MSDDNTIDTDLLLDALRRMEGDHFTSAYAHIQEDPEAAERFQTQSLLLAEIRHLVKHLDEFGELPPAFQGEKMDQYVELVKVRDHIGKLDQQNSTERESYFADRGVR
jgi:hypothetical protein